MGDSSLDNIIGVKNQVSDTTILTGLWISSVIGVAVLILFCVLQRTSLLYRYRLVAGQVRVKPPPLREHGLASFIDWAVKSISVSDVAFVQSCGLDALIMVKICALGVQLFLPLCILGVLILVPLHWTGGDSKNLDADQSGFMRLTMSNIPSRSHIFWVHVVFVYIYLGWAMVLLRWHYHQYLTIRQYYLRKGDDMNLWRALYEQKEPSAAAEGDGGKIGNLLRSVPLIKAFMPSGVPVVGSGDVTPAKESDEEDEVYPLGGVGASLVRKRSARASMSPPGSRSGVGAVDGAQRRGAVRRSEVVVRPVSPNSVRAAGLARRSLPPSAFGAHGSSSARGSGSASVSPTGGGGMGGMPPWRAHRQMSLHHSGSKSPSRSKSPSTKLFNLPSAQQRLFSSGSVDSLQGKGLPDGGAAVGARRGSRGGAGGGGRRPIAEATEGPQEHAEDEPAAAAAAQARGTRASVPPATAYVHGGAATPPKPPLPLQAALPPRPPQHHQEQQHPGGEPCGASEVRLQLRKSHSRGRSQRHDRFVSGAVHPTTTTTVISPDPPDLEAGLAPPAAAAPMSRGASAMSADDDQPHPYANGGAVADALSLSYGGAGLDPDAHLLEWWQERREVELPLGPVDTLRQQLTMALGAGRRGGSRRSEAAATVPEEDGDAEAGDGSGASVGVAGAAASGRRMRVEVGVDLTRPSVGHRKTVNALYPGGTRVAVLAQHYAVLVTDVIERRPEDRPRSDKAANQSQETTAEPSADKAESTRSAPRRMASFLPRWLRSWCNLQYGSLAAQRLDPTLRMVPSGDISAIVSAASTMRTIHNASLASASNAQQSAPVSSECRLAPALAPSHRRVRSAIDAPSPPSTLLAQMHTWSSAAAAAGTASESPAATGSGRLMVSASPPASLRQPASLTRGTPGGSGKGAGDKFIKLLELMARDARQKLAAQSLVSGGSRSGVDAAAAAAAVAAADASGTARTHSGNGDIAAVGVAGGAPRAPSVRAVATTGSPRPTPSPSASGSLPEGARPQAGASRQAAPAPVAPATAGAGPVAEALEGQEPQEAGGAAAAGEGAGGEVCGEAATACSPASAAAAAGTSAAAGASSRALPPLQIPSDTEAEAEAYESPFLRRRHVAVSPAAAAPPCSPASVTAAAGTSDAAGTSPTAVPPLKIPPDPEAEAEVEAGERPSLRRRHVSVSPAAAPEDAAPKGAEGGGDDGDDFGGDDGDDGGGAAGSGANGPVTAAERWAFLREAVWNGDVARLPWRSRYSVVSSTFLRLFPDEFDRAIPVINFKEVDLLLMRVDRHMAQYEYAVQYEEETGKQLVRRVGCCGLTGARRRLREYHREEVNKLLAEVRKARLRALNTSHTPSWFVFFRTQRAAAMASQCLIHAEDNRQFRVHPAPGPDEVNWSALWSNFRSRDLRRNLMRPLVVLVVLFPIGIFTGALTQLDYLLCPSHVCVNVQQDTAAWTDVGCTAQIYRRESRQVTWDWYCEQKDPFAKLLKRLVVAWLPSLLLVLWQGMVLPLIFTVVVQVGREARSLSEADRCIAKNMFYFAIFNVFLGGVAGSTIFQGINSAIEKGPSEIFNLVGTYVPTSSNFFINYTMFRAFVAVPLRMLWPHIGIRMYLIRRYLRCSCVITSRERAFLMAPVSPRYGFEVGMVMIIFLVGFAFAVVSPVLLPLALLFFAVSWVFWRWALLYVYVRKYEGGGTMWPFTFNRVMVCMAIFPVFTACVFITKHAYPQAIFLLVTFPVVLIRFNKYCYYRFETGLQALPLEATLLAPDARVEPWVYTPPPLLFNLAGWHPDWSKAWMGWNLPVVYG